MSEVKQSLLGRADPFPADIPDNVTLLALPGSHYVMKVMAALDYKRVPYTIRFIHPLRLKKDLRPPHTVPVLLWGSEYIPDSSRILRFLDEKFPSTCLYPTDVPVQTSFKSVDEAEKWLADVLYEWCMYWQWLDWEGYSNSLRISLAREIPLPMCMQKLFFCCCSVDALTRGKKNEIRQRLERSLGAAQFATRTSAVQNTAAALQRLERSLASEAQRYLLGTDAPTAADFTAYGMLVRLVDDAFDARVGPCYADAFRDARVPRLQAWYERMRRDFPLRFYR